MTTKVKPKHFLTGEELSSEQLMQLLQTALLLKKERHLQKTAAILAGKHLALLFDKPSLRTRFSFAIAMQELGGTVVESVGSSRKTETPEDQAQVLSGYCHAMMVRTHDDSIVERMRHISRIPIINGLTKLHHPCQILADLLTLLEIFKSLEGLTLSYIGDGNNILHSLLLLAPQMGINIHYCCPATRGPHEGIVRSSMNRIKKLTGEVGVIQSFATPAEAVAEANAVYTDVWTSMGFENEAEEHLFAGFQVNEKLMKQAPAGAVFMHCLPMERGKEVSETLADDACSVVYQQSENRLHAQKALLLYLLT